ncbi:hypothetical protein T310_4252 [Rasamsonia emersonii CBS 393.64]|uniref:Uncharacterized protein n=1 Tax=Rasamsonia emersonii (strain ATCC 16479 / CBS 393.64 / IMI 116815) TaxID=1408163 RepID=A0A0F4YV66_RASE3|nr:hypothetical protein T310_4252 [Rasamsonia emersonii CBS 393.64]KKA21731.1 hypothetical protein T310_4252 [Rasamsonia emersonii CBS 393.64]
MANLAQDYHLSSHVGSSSNINIILMLNMYLLPPGKIITYLVITNARETTLLLAIQSNSIQFNSIHHHYYYYLAQPPSMPYPTRGPNIRTTGSSDSIHTPYSVVGSTVDTYKTAVIIEGTVHGTASGAPDRRVPSTPYSILLPWNEDDTHLPRYLPKYLPSYVRTRRLVLSRNNNVDHGMRFQGFSSKVTASNPDRCQARPRPRKDGVPAFGAKSAPEPINRSNGFKKSQVSTHTPIRAPHDH